MFVVLRIQLSVEQVIVVGVPAAQAFPAPVLPLTKMVTVVPGARPLSVVVKAVPTLFQVTPPLILY